MTTLPVEGGSLDPVEEILRDLLDRRRRGEPLILSNLLAGHTELAPRVLEVLSAVLAMEDLGGPATETLDLPKRIGDYQPLREIGRGGMGVVYEAEQVSLRRRVALKVMTAQRGVDPTLVERFRREAGVASRLHHPGICTVHGAGVDNGTPYIAMALVEGRSLAELIASARSSPDSTLLESERHTRDASLRTPVTRAEVLRMLRLLEDAASALHVAHDAGIVHRDVKPGNIMVTPEGRPVLLDFGLAADLQGDVPALTQTGDVFGTPAYMAPEQLDGAHASDRRVDVYALGVTLYQALTLRHPFPAPTRQALFEAIRNQEPPDPRRFNPDIPRDAVIVLQTAMEKDRGRRYQTAQALAEDLRRVRESRPILARPAPLLLRMRRWIARHPAAFLLIACMTVLGPVIASLVTHAVLSRDAIEAGERTLHQRRLDSLLEDAFAFLGTFEPWRAVPEFRKALAFDRTNAEAAAGLAYAYFAMRETKECLSVLEAHPHLTQEHQSLSLLAAQARNRLELGRDLDADSEIGPKTALDYFFLGYWELLRGEKGSPDAFTRSASAFTQAILRSSRKQTIHHQGKLHALSRTRNLQAVHETAEVLTSLWPEHPRTWLWIGKALRRADDPKGAVMAFERALARNRDDPGILASLGDACRAAEDPERALALAQRCLEVDPTNGEAWVVIATCHFDRGDVDQSIAAYQEALRRDPELQVAHHNWGEALRSKGQLDEALVHYRESLRVDPNYARGYQGSGFILFQREELDEAEKCFAAAVARDPYLGESWKGLARCRHARGDIAGTIEALANATRSAPDNLEYGLGLASMLIEANRSGEAIPVLEHLKSIAPPESGVFLLLAQAALDSGDALGALATCEEARSRADPDALAGKLDAVVDRGRSLLAQGRRLDDYLRRQDTVSLEELVALARAARELRRHEDQVTVLGRIAALVPQEFCKPGGLRDDAALGALKAARGVVDPKRRGYYERQARQWMKDELTAWIAEVESHPGAARRAQKHVRAWMAQPPLVELATSSSMPSTDPSAWRELLSDLQHFLDDLP